MDDGAEIEMDGALVEEFVLRDVPGSEWRTYDGRHGFVPSGMWRATLNFRLSGLNLVQRQAGEYGAGEPVRKEIEPEVLKTLIGHYLEL